MEKEEEKDMRSRDGSRERESKHTSKKEEKKKGIISRTSELKSRKIKVWMKMKEALGKEGMREETERGKKTVEMNRDGERCKEKRREKGGKKDQRERKG